MRIVETDVVIDSSNNKKFKAPLNAQIVSGFNLFINMCTETEVE